VPTLVLTGKYDGTLDSCIEPFLKGIKGVEWVKFAHSAHMPQFEEPEEFLKVLGGFLSKK